MKDTSFSLKQYTETLKEFETNEKKQGSNI